MQEGPDLSSSDILPFIASAGVGASPAENRPRTALWQPDCAYHFHDLLQLSTAQKPFSELPLNVRMSWRTGGRGSWGNCLQKAKAKSLPPPPPSLQLGKIYGAAHGSFLR